MVKVRKISEIEPTLGFTEFDILKRYRQSFACSEMGGLHSVFPFKELALQMDLKDSRLGRKSYFVISNFEPTDFRKVKVTDRFDNKIFLCQ